MRGVFRLRSGVGLGLSACLALLFSGSGFARADEATAAACTKSYESAQILKKNREYLAARRELQACIRVCPAIVQRECGQWLDGLDSVIPSVVIHAEAGGEDRSEVKVEMDGKVLLRRIDGKGVEVDPGQHDFTFSLEGFPPVKKTVLVHEGEQLRVVHVGFEQPEVARAAQSSSVPMRRPVPVPVYVLGGLAVAGGAGFAVFGLVGTSQRNRLERQCEPRCTDAQVDGVHTNLLLADISLVVGLAALASGAIVWLTRPSVPASPERPAVSVSPSRTGATVAVTLQF
jgi:hypothetical protein